MLVIELLLLLIFSDLLSGGDLLLELLLMLYGHLRLGLQLGVELRLLRA